MTETDYYQQFERNIKAKLEAEKAKLEADTALELLEMRKNLGLVAPRSDSVKQPDSNHKEKVAELIEEYEDEITVKMVQFLGEEFRSTPEVAGFLAVSESKVKRLIGVGSIEARRVTGFRGHAISTLSVVRSLIDHGPTLEE